MKAKIEKEEGIIELDTPFARKLGFTSDRFDGWLAEKEGYIFISFIESKQQGKGHFRELLGSIERLGYGIKVPTPLKDMQRILKKYRGFKKTFEPFAPEMDVNDLCEVWVRERK